MCRLVIRFGCYRGWPLNRFVRRIVNHPIEEVECSKLAGPRLMHMAWTALSSHGRDRKHASLNCLLKAASEGLIL